VSAAEAAFAPRRRLIVNGDDFGLAPEVNRAIARAHREGILTTTSLMVSAPAVAAAVDLARQMPRLGVGLHLVLVQGRPALPASEAAPLALPNGRFRESAIPAAMHYFFRPEMRRLLRREIRAQLEAFRATGLALDHVDGHLNIHLHPVMQSILADLAPEFGIRAVRLTRDPLGEALRFDPRHLLRKSFEGGAFRILSAIAERRFARLGIVSADRLYGLHQSGHCDEKYLRHLIATLPPGDTELYCHPAERQTAEMARLMPGYEPGAELAALTAPGVRTMIDAERIELVTYGELYCSA
jgi:hopanoid biosynthesis associated protein HpnK